jgi:fatty acid desaturase
MSTSRAPEAKLSFSERGLNQEVMRLREVDNATNLAFLVLEYGGLAAVIGGAILFREWRQGSGLSWWWDIPVLALAIVSVGAIQHRLAGLGHESAHYTLLKNKFLNDLVGDVFCMFPILSNVHFYRLFHLAHHQYTNDPKRDPDLVVLGASKMVERFPMRRWEFIKSFYLRAFTEPLEFLRYEQDYLDINVLGRSENVYVRRLPESNGSVPVWPRLGAMLGLFYLLAFIAGQWAITSAGRPGYLLYEGIFGTSLVAALGWVLPGSAYFQSPFRQRYSSRASGVLRLAYYSWFLVGLGLLRAVTEGQSSFYFWVLWVLPMMTTFPFFMLLRDVYQHTNADAGRLTNTRVFFPDPFTRWAVFVYGQDMHIPHHLFPAIPHHRLGRLHRLLKARHPEYAASVVECHGTFANRKGLPTILDTLTTPRPGG